MGPPQYRKRSKQRRSDWPTDDSSLFFNPDAELTPVATVDTALLTRNQALQASINAGFHQWGRNRSAEDRIVISAFMPSIETGDPEQIEAVSARLLEMVRRRSVRKPRKPVTLSALRHLTERCLSACLARDFAPPPALTEIAVFLLKEPALKHRRKHPEAYQRAIEFIVNHHQSKGKIPSRRAIAKFAGVSDSTVRNWLEDSRFIDEVNEHSTEFVEVTKFDKVKKRDKTQLSRVPIHSKTK
jgi:hypothetical protein